jgi:hypothetical protein
MWPFPKSSKRPRSVVTVAPILDPILGEIVYDNNSWFTAVIPHDGKKIEISLATPAADDTAVEPGALSSARRIAQDPASIIEQALVFLATSSGFGGFERVRAIFSLTGIVTTRQDGWFWLTFKCSEDRDPKAIWRVEFENWVPHGQGRDD